MTRAILPGATFPASTQTLAGKVTAIDAESAVTNNVVQYKVTVSLPTAGPSIRLGQTADVTITTARHANTLYVPTSAVSTTADGRSTVTRRANGTDSVVEVKTGLVGAAGTEIVAGLAERDLLVLPTGNNAGTFTFPGAGGSSGSSGSASPSSSASPR
jgi:HlyD family secretion protein